MEEIGRFGYYMTTDKSAQDMGEYELFLNNCFADNGEAMIRDYDGTHTARDIIRELAKSKNIEISAKYNIDFDLEMLDWLEATMTSLNNIENNDKWLLAMLYDMICSKAELYERLKRYENEERELSKAQEDA